MSGPQTAKPGRNGLSQFLLRRRGVGFLSLLVLFCLGISWFPWTNAEATRPTATTVPPPLTLNPTSGPAGTSISVSLIFDGARGGYAGLQTTIAFDSTQVGNATIVQCSAAGTSGTQVGFGTGCTGSAVNIQAPQDAVQGAHPVTVTIPANPLTGGAATSTSATFTVTPPAIPLSLTLDPTSGAAGSLDSVSLIGLLNVAFSRTAVLTFDGASIGSQAIVACSNNLQGAGGSGFGAACTGNAFNAQIPVGAQPGPHTVTATISSPTGAAPTTVSATFTVVQTTPPTLILNPTSGLAGSTTSVSLINLPANTTQLNAVITFDTTQIDQQVIVTCTAAGGSGFGIACNGNPVNDLIPADAQVGPHMVTATITYPTNTQLPPITVTAPYSVSAPNATATSTATPLPNATVIPVTNTPVAIATATATATPAPRPILMLVRSDFDSGVVLISLHGPANAKVRLDLQIKQGGVAKFSLTRQGTTNKAGVYGTSLHVTLSSRMPGRASVTVAITQGGTVMKAVHYLTYP